MIQAQKRGELKQPISSEMTPSETNTIVKKHLGGERVGNDKGFMMKCKSRFF